MTTDGHQQLIKPFKASIALVAVAVVGMFFAPVSKSQMPAFISLKADEVGVGSDSKVTYELNVTAGSAGATFGLAYQLSSWPMSKVVSGSPIAIKEVRFSGLGSMRPATVPPVPKPSLSREETCRREQSSPFASAYWVEMPANGKAAIRIKASASYPGWPGTKYDVEFSTFEVDQPLALHTPLQVVSVPALGALGTHLIMHSVKADGHSRGLRMTPEIVGHTDPPLRRSSISFRAVRPLLSGSVSLEQWNEPRPASIALGSVRTNVRGRFRLSPQRFPFAGRYGILARSKAKGDLVPDWNCGPFFRR